MSVTSHSIQFVYQWISSGEWCRSISGPAALFPFFPPPHLFSGGGCRTMVRTSLATDLLVMSPLLLFLRECKILMADTDGIAGCYFNPPLSLFLPQNDRWFGYHYYYVQ